MPRWMQTFTGRRISVLSMRPSDVCLEDIAHALSRLCRYAGHVKNFYSVAEHSVLVSRLCKPRDALWGLLHDASEAYLCDLPTGVKALLNDYRVVEDHVQKIVAEKFGLSWPMPVDVHVCDSLMIGAECKYAMGIDPAEWGYQVWLNLPIWEYDPPTAERIFLARFNEIMER